MSGLLDVTALYEAMLGREGTPRERLGYLFAFHMDEGTRPLGDPRQLIPWSSNAMRKVFGSDQRNISHYRQGKRKFPLQKALMAFLGPADGDTPERRRWRRDILDFYRVVKDEPAPCDTPTHSIYAVRKPNAEDASWFQIGTASPNKRGRGLNLKLHLLPVGEAEIVLCKIDDDGFFDTKLPEPVD